MAVERPITLHHRPDHHLEVEPWSASTSTSTSTSSTVAARARTSSARLAQRDEDVACGFGAPPITGGNAISVNARAAITSIIIGTSGGLKGPASKFHNFLGTASPKTNWSTNNSTLDEASDSIATPRSRSCPPRAWNQTGKRGCLPACLPAAASSSLGAFSCIYLAHYLLPTHRSGSNIAVLQTTGSYPRQPHRLSRILAIHRIHLAHSSIPSARPPVRPPIALALAPSPLPRRLCATDQLHICRYLRRATPPSCQPRSAAGSRTWPLLLSSVACLFDTAHCRVYTYVHPASPHCRRCLRLHRHRHLRRRPFASASASEPHRNRATDCTPRVTRRTADVARLRIGESVPKLPRPLSLPCLAVPPKPPRPNGEPTQIAFPPSLCLLACLVLPCPAPLSSCLVRARAGSGFNPSPVLVRTRVVSASLTHTDSPLFPPASGASRASCNPTSPSHPRPSPVPAPLPLPSSPPTRASARP